MIDILISIQYMVGWIIQLIVGFLFFLVYNKMKIYYPKDNSLRYALLLTALFHVILSGMPVILLQNLPYVKHIFEFLLMSTVVTTIYYLCRYIYE